MQIFTTFLGTIIVFFIGFKFGRRPKRVSTVHLWDRELSYEEIETLYKAEKLIEESYSNKV